MRRLAIPIAGLFSASAPASAEPASMPWFSVPISATYLTGDTWSHDGVSYRLYGVQACLRGASFTNAHGVKRDCGEASLAMLVALNRDLRPQCYSAARSASAVFVFCVALRTNGAAPGSRIDLGTALIASGYAFAALKPDGEAVHPPYLAAQQVAERSRAGLWAFADLPNPSLTIQRALTSGAPTPSSTAGSVTTDSAQPRRSRP